MTLSRVQQWLSARMEGNDSKNSIAVLDGVRAIACLLVIWFHIDLITRDTHLWDSFNANTQLFNSLMYVGYVGVTLFFVLSGFLLFMPYARALLFDQKNWPSARKFYLRRVFRIIPAYYLTLILLVLLSQQQYLQPDHWGQLGLFFAFFMDSSPVTYQKLNGPFWTLAVEWQFYMLLPLIVLLIRQLAWRVSPPKRLPATIACLLLMIAWAIFWRSQGIYFTSHPSQTLIVPRPVLNFILLFTFGVNGKYLEDFAVGMLLSLLYIYAQHPATSEKLQQALRRLSPWLWGTGILLLVGMAMWNYNIRKRHSWPFLDVFLPYFGTFAEVLFACGFGLCILAILYDSQRLVRFFAWVPLRRIGLISYSMYMWHLPLLSVLLDYGRLVWSNVPSLVAYSLYWLWVLLVIIPFCMLFYLFIERPGMKFGERFQRKRVAVQRMKPAEQMKPPGEQEKLEVSAEHAASRAAP